MDPTTPATPLDRGEPDPGPGRRLNDLDKPRWGDQLGHFDHDAAVRAAMAMFAEEERMLQLIEDDPAIIPASLRFYTVDETTAREIVAAGKDATIVSNVAIAQSERDQP